MNSKLTPDRPIASTFGLSMGDAIVSALITFGSIPDEVRPLLTVDLFTKAEQRIHIDSILEADREFGACDILTVREVLDRRGMSLDPILDLVALDARVPSQVHLLSHVKALRQRVMAVHCLSQGAEEFLGADIRPVEWAIQDVWPIRNSGPIGGPEKVGKTWIAHEMVLSLTTATPFLGRYHVSRPFMVLYWEEEDSSDRTRRRGKQLLAGRNRPMPSADHLRYLVGHGLKIDQPEGLKILRTEIEQFRPDFVVVGNLREIHTKDENRPEMAQVRDAFRSLSREFGCGFVLMHHFRKQQEGQSRRGSQMLAGSGVWGAWAEAWMWVTPGATEDMAIVEVGSKDAAGIGKFMVQRRDVTDGEPLAESEDGRKMYPVVLAEVDRKGRVDESRDKVRRVGEVLYEETQGAVTIKEIKAKTNVKERTVRERVRELVKTGVWQEVDLPGNYKGYVPNPADTLL